LLLTRLAGLCGPVLRRSYGVGLSLLAFRAPTLAEGIARRIAEALEHARERGVIHRDLKPSNIKVTPEDNVKVLASGLAKALAPPRYLSCPKYESAE